MPNQNSWHESGRQMSINNSMPRESAKAWHRYVFGHYTLYNPYMTSLIFIFHYPNMTPTFPPMGLCIPIMSIHLWQLPPYTLVVSIFFSIIPTYPQQYITQNESGSAILPARTRPPPTAATQHSIMEYGMMEKENGNYYIIVHHIIL